jgi:hypothetical protein
MTHRLLVAWVASLTLAPALWAQVQMPPAPAPVRAAAEDTPIVRPATGPLTPEAIQPTAGILPAGALEPGCAPCGPYGRMWVSTDALLWWIQGSKLPPLVTTSTPGTPAAIAGALDQPDTNVLIGGGEVNGNMRLGFRTRVGGWLDAGQRLGVEAEFLILSATNTEFGALSDGSTILARPLTNATTLNATTSLIAFPGTAFGSAYVASSTGNLVGTGIWLRENFCCSGDRCNTCALCSGGCADGGCGAGGCADGGCAGNGWGYRFDSIFGYRYLRLSDRLLVGTDVTTIPGSVNTKTLDEFGTTNDFHGVDIGVTGDIRRDWFFMEMLAKVAVGYNQRSSTALGLTNGPAGTVPGGLLVQSTNFGTVDRSAPTAVPELGLKLGYNSGRFRAYVGYTFLYWYHVARANDQVDRLIDPAFLGAPGGATPPTRPANLLQDTDIWIQGVTLGMEWRY